MIVPDEKTSKSLPELPPDSTTRMPPPASEPSTESTLDASERPEPPPSYTPSSPDAGPSSSTVTQPRTPVPPPTRPSNYVLVDRRNDGIKGAYVIDPSLFIPASFLGPIPEGRSTRPNLRLFTSNGNIKADVHVVAGTQLDSKAPERANLEAESKNGQVTFRLRNYTEIPLTLTVLSHNGTVKVFLPRNFRGTVTQASHNGSLKMTDTMAAHVVTFTETKGRRTIFVGDMDRKLGGWDDSGDNWLGDAVSLESKNGSVEIGWLEDDEDENRGGRGGDVGLTGFFSRFFGGAAVDVNVRRS